MEGSLPSWGPSAGSCDEKGAKRQVRSSRPAKRGDGERRRQRTAPFAGPRSSQGKETEVLSRMCSFYVSPCRIGSSNAFSGRETGPWSLPSLTLSLRLIFERFGGDARVPVPHFAMDRQGLEV